MRIPTIVAVMLVALASSAEAQRSGKAIGVGNFGCGQYLEHREEKNATQIAVYVSWVWGFLSAYNLHSTRPPLRELPDQPTVLAYFDKFCRDEPLGSVMQGTAKLIADLGGYRPPYLDRK